MLKASGIEYMGLAQLQYLFAEYLPKRWMLTLALHSQDK